MKCEIAGGQSKEQEVSYKGTDSISELIKFSRLTHTRYKKSLNIKKVLKIIILISILLLDQLIFKIKQKINS